MNVHALMQEEIPQVLIKEFRNHGPALRGWLAGAFEKSIDSNPYDESEDDWGVWRSGWFRANRGEEATYQPDSWGAVPND